MTKAEQKALLDYYRAQRELEKFMLDNDKFQYDDCYLAMRKGMRIATCDIAYRLGYKLELDNGEWVMVKREVIRP